MREDLSAALRGQLRDWWTLVGGFIFIAVVFIGCGERENFLEIEMPTDLRSIEQASSSDGSVST
ncbi:MAG: hypothetical protein KF876_13895, partial [Nitrospira sp.]|nr:hypothetical protein [Nitrospira sp.]